MPDCIFCKIANKEIPAQTVWENERFIAFLDRHPVNTGHTLLIPKEHYETIFDMPVQLYTDLFATGRTLAAPLQEVIQSKKIGYIVEGFGVVHAHLHLVPINNPHELDSSRAHEIPAEELIATKNKIENYIKSKQI